MQLTLNNDIWKSRIDIIFTLLYEKRFTEKIPTC